MLLASLALASAFAAPCVVQREPIEGELTFLRWDDGAESVKVAFRGGAFREETLRGLTDARIVPVAEAERYRLKLCFREGRR